MFTSDLITTEQEALDALRNLAQRGDMSNPKDKEELRKAALKWHNITRLIESRAGHINPIKLMQEV